VSADISFDNGGWAGVMGRINATGNGWDGDPNGYYARLDADGTGAIYIANQQFSSRGSRDKALATNSITGWKAAGWHNVKLRFQSSKLTLLVDGQVVVTAEDATFGRGMAGLITGGQGNARNSALFDNVLINTVNGGAVKPTVFAQDRQSLYKK